MDDVVIRQARLEDAPALTRLINAAFVVETGHFKDRERTNEDEVREWLGSGKFFVAEAAEPANVADTVTKEMKSSPEPMASIYVEPRGETCYFGLLSVDPARQGQGLGRRLTQFAEDWARKQGAKAMELRYVDLREELGRTYSRMGYVEASREDVPVGRGFTRVAQFVNMRKTL
jgi:GNAT superfamily N-acetyltransferase